MDTANYAGPLAKIPRELQATDITQNSETINQTNDDGDEVKIEMNWNIAEQLPEEGNCRAEFEALLKLLMDALVLNNNSVKDGIEAITMYAYEIVQRLHKGHAPGKVSPATHFCNALIEVLSQMKDVEAEVRYKIVLLKYLLNLIKNFINNFFFRFNFKRFILNFI